LSHRSVPPPGTQVPSIVPAVAPLGVFARTGHCRATGTVGTRRINACVVQPHITHRTQVGMTAVAVQRTAGGSNFAKELINSDLADSVGYLIYTSPDLPRPVWAFGVEHLLLAVVA